MPFSPRSECSENSGVPFWNFLRKTANLPDFAKTHPRNFHQAKQKLLGRT
jgi:hypothetical protein